jgi:biopolymer transport protein ExbD
MILPESSAQKKPELNVTITVNNHNILAENKLIANTHEVLSSEDLVIPNLNAWLKQRREMTEKIAMYSTKAKFTGNVTIVGDRRIRFALLKKIMYTCGQQGYNNFALAVRKKEG